MRVLMCLSIALAFAPRGRAADPSPEATARASLALAKAKALPVIAAAPAPWPKVVGSYAEAKRVSLQTRLPIAVFVGCEPTPAKNREYITARVEQLEGYAVGTVVICYPADETIWADAQISCTAPPEAIEKAARDAGKKVEARPKGKRLDWS